jgi:hypothetical protein
MSAPLIHIHEDDWGMRNLYPAVGTRQAVRDIAAAKDAGARNATPDGAGWTDVHVIEPPETDFEAVGLRLSDVEAALAPLLPRVKRFYATASAGFGADARDPYGSYEENAHCFGVDRGCFIKVDAKGEFAKQIWFEATAEDLTALRKGIVALDALTPLIVADYWLDMTGAVGDPSFMERYFAALDEGE